MNRSPDNERLLNDVLSEGARDDFSRALLAETLALARRKRRLRQARQLGSALALFVVAAILIVRSHPDHPIDLKPANPRYQLVQTMPLAVGQIVATRPLASGQFVVSSGTVAVVLTKTSDAGVRELNDDELLALAPQPAALVRLGPREMQLVIVKPDESDNAPVN
jgi:hypothetical protein